MSLRSQVIENHSLLWESRSDGRIMRGVELIKQHNIDYGSLNSMGRGLNVIPKHDF